VSSVWALQYVEPGENRRIASQRRELTGGRARRREQQYRR
jgi:hypothetical protein